MKKFKTGRKRKLYIVILILISIIAFTLISLLKLNSSHKKIIDILLNDSLKEKKTVSLRFLTSNLDNLLNDYYFNTSPHIVKNENKIIYLYNTHDEEKYYDNSSILEASKLLQQNLNKLGIEAINEEQKTSELIITGLSSYDISRVFIQNIREKYRDINYYIDIHRDSVDAGTITINNKKYAKIMFVLGKENKDYEKNKIIISKMNDYLNTNYPGLSRGIYEKWGSGVDGVYNQDLSERVILIEIGGIKNNIEEVNNSTEIIALMLYHMLGD